MATPTHGPLADHPADMDMEDIPALEWTGELQVVDSGVRRRIKSTLILVPITMMQHGIGSGTYADSTYICLGANIQTLFCPHSNPRTSQRWRGLVPR